MTPPFRKRRRQLAERLQAKGTMFPVAEAFGNRSLAVAGDVVGVVQTGDNARSVTLPPEALRPPAEVDAPPGLDNLPYRGVFVGRTTELKRLDAALAAPGEVVVQAVHGLGGIGKSALAMHWAATRARTQGYTPIRWITADSPAAVQQGLADLATALQPALAQALPVEELAERALVWLATHTGWLLILDNVNNSKDIAPLLARATGGRFLITSRLATAWRDAATLVPLDVLEEAESLDLLTRIATSATGPRDLDGAAKLCGELGHLPLAIEQAAAYLAQSPLLTPRGYLGLLAQSPDYMYRTGGVGVTDTERTVARIWHLTLDRIHRDQPHATNLLRALAWYAPDHIPVTLLASVTDTPTFTSALGLLTAYNMVTADPAAATLTVHRLVQALARTPDLNDPHRTPHLIDQARHTATAQLCAVLPHASEDPITWPVWRALLPHAEALADHLPPETDTDNTAEVLNRIGMFLAEQGSTGRAIEYLERALGGAVRAQGKKHPSTIAIRSNLANAYVSAGDPTRAIPLHEQVLKARVRALGKNHPDTLTSRSNLAYASALVEGGPTYAIPLHEQVLKARVRVLGEDHPRTLVARSNLAYAYTLAGDPTRAIPLHKQALEAQVPVLGEDHPDTLTSRSNLAYAYMLAGDSTRAILLHEQVLEARVRVLGEDHPDTLVSRSKLANAYALAGDVAGAIPLHEQVLEARVRVLGEDHPRTLVARNNLVYACMLAGDVTRAIPLYQQSLEAKVRVLGEDHPETHVVRNNLAYAYTLAGDSTRGIPLYEQALEALVGVLGEDHPRTLVARNNLAAAYTLTGDSTRGIPLYEQALEALVRVLGEDHPDTLTSRSNLAYAYMLAGDSTRAILLYEQALEALVGVLGEDHPRTLVARNNLAAAYTLTGDRAGAIPLYQQALHRSVRILGEEHETTATVRANLSDALRAQGD